MRSEAGEQMVLKENFFVERILPGAILRDLTPEEHDAYRRPFATPEDRWPTLQWPEELPIQGEPADVVESVGAYGNWLSRSPVPKLFFNASPGSILTGHLRDFCRTWPNQTELTVRGLHYVPEDSAPQIGAAVADWIPHLPLRIASRHRNAQQAGHDDPPT
jgi:haloalkane dehalogenase